MDTIHLATPFRRAEHSLRAFLFRLLRFITNPQSYDHASVERLLRWSRGTLSTAEPPGLEEVINAFGDLLDFDPLTHVPARTSLASREEVYASLSRSAAHRSRLAWSQRAEILRAADRPETMQRFIALVNVEARQAYTVPQAAQELFLSVRQLGRLSTVEFGFPPGLVIDLGRIVSVEKALAETAATLKSIALSHGFPDKSAMAHHFLRFVGVPPGAYRGGPKR